MSFPRAVAFLWVASARNRVLRQLQRLRQPKYLVGAVVGGLYLYSVFLRRLGFPGGQVGSAPAAAQLISQFMFTAAMLGTLLSAWALGPDRPSLSFTETEVQQLFSAPVSRRGLLHYKLARSLLGAAVGAAFTTLFVSRVVRPHPVFFFIGSTVTLATVNLHVMAASFVRTRLARLGGPGTMLRWVLLSAVSALMIGAGMAALREHPFPQQLKDPRQLQEWIVALMDSPVMALGRWLVALPLAPDGWAFLKALPLGLGLLAAHYLWVMKAAVPFEDAAVSRAEERSRLREQLSRQGGRPTRIRASPTFLRLAPTGRPEVAILWKNLIAGQRLGGAGRLIIAGLVGGLVASAASAESLPEVLDNMRMFMTPLCGGLAVLLCFFGPSAMRMDLRMDLPRLEQLRALPLTGRQVVMAELAAPALLLGVTQVGLLLLAGVLSVWQGGSRTGLWVAGGLGAVWVLPAVTLGGLFVQNAAVVLFPAWLPPEGERVRGLEALGQRLLTLAGTLVVLLVGMLPAALLGALVGFALDRLLELGVWAIPFAGLVAAAVLVAEVALGVVGLGHAFDRLDVSREGTGMAS
ncbi:putative ABC exporter domain-containing protein [Vitiosangium sp. GDMCC 1.1324]|uniref:putative ABC exporter domain-containing protein n=1 Tax=Vitiosangium sp. (strain GDMCC 1.1324) TaxID=2138576 RepID=UPI000D3CDBC5|nr:putative ABC exporter domain-containing protein [Vitiosangium sp. GDMCC 1.1324]PTL85841.1 ABC transporter permease [Vitiosangium sp. GDMCC 1.1324]